MNFKYTAFRLFLFFSYFFVDFIPLSIIFLLAKIPSV